MAELIVPVPQAATTEHHPLRGDLLRWLYVGRMTLVSGILAGALFVWFEASSQDTLVVVVMFLFALIVTGVSYWHTHVRGHEPSENFLYAQVIMDVLLVTGIVHVTGGPASGFASVYILVISAGALLLPLPGGVLIGGLVSIVYFADLAWGHQGSFTIDVALRIVLFSVVALITGLVGDRLRRAGQALGAVASQLHQLRLDTGDILANLSTGVITVTGDGQLAYANPAASTLLGVDLHARLGQPVLGVHRGDRTRHGRDSRARDRGGRLRDARSRAHHEGEGDQPRGQHGDPGAGRGGAPVGDGALPGHHRAGAHGRAERARRAARGGGRALGFAGARDQEPPRVDPERRGAARQGPRVGERPRDVLQRLVLTESDRLSRLLSEFLEFSGLKMSARDEVDLHQVVRGCLVVAKQHPDTTDVEIVAELDQGPILVVGDADLLHRALFNLVLNGAQSAGPGGRVRVSLADLRDQPTPRGTEIEHAVRLTVSDSGKGITSDVRNRIFDPFFTTKPKGSGLGLAVVHRAVEAHSGATFVERGPEGGAQFVILLPGLPAGVAAADAGASK